MTTTPEPEKSYHPDHPDQVDLCVIQKALRSLIVDLGGSFVDAEETLLHAASRKGNLQVVQVLTTATIDVNARDSEGRTPLHYVFCFADEEEGPGPCAADMVDLLLQAGADPNAPDEFGVTPLHCACHGRHDDSRVEIVKLMVEAGADPNTPTSDDDEGATPLHAACRYASAEIVKILVDKGGADVSAKDSDGCTALFWASDAEIVKILLDHGAVIDCHAVGLDNQTPLHVACSSGHADVAKGLLACDEICLEAKSCGGNTPLHLAAQNENVSIVELLVEHGANLDATNEDGDTPLHFACYNNEQIHVVQALVERGANTFAKNHENETPLDDAMGQDHTTVVNYLLASYREVVLEQKGCHCLHAVFRQTHDVWDSKKVNLPIGTLAMDQLLKLVDQLVSCRPDCIQAAQDDDESSAGERALHVACRADYPVPVIRALVAHDADSVCSPDKRGATPLHYACRCANKGRWRMEVLRFLVEKHAAALLQTDATGSLPLHAACRAGCDLETISFLVKQGGVGTLTARDQHGALPLHAFLCASSSSKKDPGVVEKVVESLVRQHPKPYPQALEETTKAGDLPIMVACEHSASLSVVYALMRAHPMALIETKKKSK